jgi:hypothetical protein
MNKNTSFIKNWIIETQRKYPMSGELECINSSTSENILDETVLLKKLIEYAKKLEETEINAKD